MQRALAAWFNQRGREAVEAGNDDRGRLWYRIAATVRPDWSVPRYNLALHAKYRGNWHESLRLNQIASRLDPEDEAAWWNLGIAATALHDWSEARRAWMHLGVSLVDCGEGEVLVSPVSACLRLDPNGSGEVVWGTRIDPARIEIYNIPLPESGHRFRDIVLNDGAQEGTRLREGREYPVFNELQIWKRSRYSTYEVDLLVPDKAAETRLIELCGEHDLGVEDWSSIRIICAECSRGNPGPHECTATAENHRATYAFAAGDETEIAALLGRWGSEFADAEFHNLRTVLVD
jgi:hypothetical protein